MPLKYTTPSANIPTERRAEINQKILTLIRAGDTQGLTPDDIFSAYTGLGGLHGLKRNDYANRYSYSEAKRELELGQFFTPPHVAEQIMQLLQPQPNHSILELAVGHGAFINAAAGLHPALEANYYGCDLDADALTVAKHLYPTAKLEHSDLATYQPGRMFDMAVGNPPFLLKLHLRGQNWRSEHLFLQRTAELLKPGGLLAVITPSGFLTDEFQDASHISRLNTQYRFLTRIPLPSDSFNANIDTSVLILQRASEHLTPRPFQPTFVDTRTWDEIRTQVIAPAVAEAEAVKHHLAREARHQDEDTRILHERIRRDLYHLSANPRLQEQHKAAQGLFDRAMHETRPAGMSNQEWVKTRITLEDVRQFTKAALRAQHTVEEDRLELVKVSGGLRYKGYDHANRKIAANDPGYSWADLLMKENWPLTLFDHPLQKVAQRKTRRHEQHSSELATLTPDETTVQELMSVPLAKSTPDGVESFNLNRAQAEDTARVLTRDYAFLALGMGSGKTAMGFTWVTRKARPQDLTFILAPALAIHQTWVPFLTANNHQHRVLKNRSDVLASKPGETLLVTTTLLHTLKRWLKRTIRKNNHKIILLVDESDELSNFESKQTQAALAVFKRARAKLLMTGTITRNSIRESYPQLLLLYNSSTLFTSEAPVIYEQDKEGELQSKPNPMFGMPFVHRAGLRNYSAAFNPTKTSVFGINRQTQDVYNLEELSSLMKRTVIRRSFNEMIGTGHYTIQQHSIPFTPPERELHQKLITEFHEFMTYFRDTGNSRKESGLRAVRQLRLLIESCLHPHLFNEFTGTGTSSKFTATVDLMLKLPPDERILLGVPRRKVFGIDYLEHWSDHLQRTGRRVFTVHGGMSFNTRNEVIKSFLNTTGAVLLASIEALRSSVNLRGTKHVIMPALGWNLPRIQQFAFRVIRMDSEPATIHFLTHQNSIETNLWQLLMSKEVGNLAVSEGRVPTPEELTRHLQLTPEMMQSLLTKEKDHDGNLQLTWVSNLTRQTASTVEQPSLF